MSKLSYKTLLIVFFFLLIGVLVLWKYVLPNNKASAAWWNDGWNYRKAINIGNSGTIQTNTQIKILDNYDLSTLVTAGKLQSDLDDLRFTDINGNLLKYWIEDTTNNSVDIWAFLPLFPTTDTTIYMYYGNSSAITGESFTGTSELPGISCLAIKLSGVTTDGIYYIDPTAQETSDKFQTYCDLTTNSGGWTLALRIATEDAENLTYSSAYWTNSNLLGTDPANVRADYKSKSYSTIAFNKILIQSFKDGTKEAWRSFLSDSTHSSMLSIISQSCQLLVGSTISNGGTPHSQDPILFGNKLYASCTNMDNNIDNARIATVNTCSYDAVYGFGTAGDNGIADRRTDDAGPNAGSWHCDNSGNRFYGYSNQCYPGGTLDYGKKLGNYSWAIFIQEPSISTIGNIANINISSAEEIGGAPIAYWKFDEGVGITAYDSTSNQNNGTISGATWQTEDQCVSGKCIFFNNVLGNKVTSSLKYDNKQYFTISAFIKPTSTNSFKIIMGTWVGNNINSGLVLDNNNLCFHDYTTFIGDRSICTSNNPIKLNQWQQVSLVYNNGSIELFVNGKSVKTGSFTITSSNNTTIIGGSYYYDYNGDRYFSGYVDEVKIYPYARTADQIKKDYNSRGTISGSSANLTSSDGNNSLTDGLVSYWKMDEGIGTSIIDLSGNNNIGTFGTGGSSPAWSNGKYGVGVSFDGSDYVGVADSNNYTISSTGFSISTWVNLNSLPPSSTSNRMWIVSKGNGNNYEWGLSVNDYDSGFGKFAFAVWSANGSTANSRISNTSASVSNWVHLVAVVKDNSAESFPDIYINGVLDNGATPWHSLTSISNGSANVQLGNRQNNSELKLDGKLDEVRIYNRALSPSEVTKLYEYAPGPIGYWDLNEGSGTSVNDISGNNLTGTFGIGSSSPSWSTGKYGGGIDFSSTTKFIDIPTGSLASKFRTNTLDRSFSYSLWFKSNNVNAVNQHLLTNNQPCNNPGSFTIKLSSGIISFGYYSLSNSTSVIHTFTPSITLLNNTWYHLEWTKTFGKTGVKAYLNGVPQTVSGDSTATGNDSSRILLGAWNGTGSTCTSGVAASPQIANMSLKGSLDEVKIYDYIRTQKQVIEDMNAGAPTTSSKSILAYYKFDEGVGTTVFNSGVGKSTLNGIFGTGTFAPVWTSNGKFNKGLIFDGSDDYVKIPQSSAINSLTEFTISFWINHDNSNVDNYIFYKGSSSPSYAIGIGHNLIYPDYWTSSGARTNLGGVSVSPNQWHQFVFTFKESSVAKIYLDGKLSTTTLVSSSIRTNSEDLYFNTYGGTTGSYNVKGIFDEVKIYDYALTDEEVKQDYNQGSAFSFGSTTQTIGNTTSSLEYCIPGDTSNCASPVAEYKMDEGVGTTAYDTSGNNINTGLRGTPIWRQGKIGKSIFFNGTTDYLSNTRKSINTGLTIGVWINTTSTDSTTGYSGNAAQNIIGDSTSNVAFGFGVHDGKVRYQHYAGAWYNVLGTVSVNDGLWHYISVTHNSSNGNISIYVDGKLDTTGNITYNGWVGYDVIGRGYSSDYFTGQLDQIRIYNYARTPAQIAWDYNKGGPVGWWKFDECQGNIAYDWSGIGNTGIINIGASGTQNSLGTCAVGISAAWTNGTNGKLNSSLYFDGLDDYVTMSDSSSLILPDTYSFSVWIKPATVSGWKTILEKGTLGTRYMFWLNGSEISAVGHKEWPYTTTTNANIVSGQWAHLIFTFDYNSSPQAKVYKNGVLLNSINNTGIGHIPNTGNSLLRIGDDPSSQNYYYSGLIDDVRIYNYALTSEQVKILYNGGAVNFN